MSSSSSRQASTQNMTDNRSVLGEGSIYANNGASVTSNTANYVLDNGAIKQAGQTVAQALDFAGDAMTGALGQVNKTSTQAFNFGGDALAFAETAFDKALDHSTSATDNLLATMQATQKLTADAYNDAKGRGAMTDKLILGAIAAMGVVAYMAVKKG